MRAREIEKWLVRLLEHGATELVDAEIAKHVLRVFALCEAMREKMRPRDARAELLGDDHTMGELHVSMAILRARAAAHEATAAAPSAPAAASPTSP